MFRERKNSFLPSMKFIQDLIIFSDFTGLVFCFVLQLIFFTKNQFVHSDVVMLALTKLLLKKY